MVHDAATTHRGYAQGSSAIVWLGDHDACRRNVESGEPVPAPVVSYGPSDDEAYAAKVKGLADTVNWLVGRST